MTPQPLPSPPPPATPAALSWRERLSREPRPDAIRQSGHYLGCNRLLPPDAASTVRVRNGRVSVTDGPWTETKDQLGGYYLIEARDLNEAIQVASRIPGAKLGCVEVRPVAEDAQTVRALGFAPPEATR